ncbi:MAG TPA: YihY/virulence factor BrkB family protein [Stellaceae bacterium]|jgi:membrane protein
MARPLPPTLWELATSALLARLGVARRRPTAAVPSGPPVPAAAAKSGPAAPDPAASRWKKILLRVWNGFSDDRIMANAAGVTYYALLALFPGIAALVSIYGLFSDPRAIAGELDAVAGVAPGGAIQVVRDQLTRLSAQGATTLGVSFVIGLVIALWSASSGIRALFDALTAVYEEKEKRSILVYYGESLLFTLATVGFLLVALVGVIAIPVVLNYLPEKEALGVLVQIVRWPVLLVLIAVGLTLVYRFGPSRDEPRWQWISWGGAFAAAAWLGASALFSWYAANFGSFNKTYGSLGAIAGFMTWMWISITVVLLGAKLNAAIEHETRRRSAGVNRAEPPARRDGG